MPVVCHDNRGWTQASVRQTAPGGCHCAAKVEYPPPPETGPPQTGTNTPTE